MIHQYVPHELRCDPEKVGAVLPLRLVLPNETKVGFVNECRALKRMVGALSPEMATRQAAQLFINQRNQRLSRARIPLTPVHQQFADLRRQGWRHISPHCGLSEDCRMLPPPAPKVKRIGPN